MAGLSLKHIYKIYPSRDTKKVKGPDGKKVKPEGVTAVSDFTMDISDGEFIVFVGPSGCGKSTTLRMIAGLEEISSGEFYIDGLLMNNVEPKSRDIAMVFQNYALYPHMTAYQNIAFGLKMRKVPKEEIDKKVHWAAEILGVEDLLNRRPKEMSGGQRQRIALGRAMVRDPKVFLLDEPLSNLDAKLRAQMRVEILRLYKTLKTTFIYVTHDQVEAMTMGTRIVVMKDGFIQQIDTPTNLFDYPENKFVAGFIGTPQMNFFDVTVKKQGAKLIVKFTNGEEQTLDLKAMRTLKEDIPDGEEREVVLGIRGESLVIDENGISSTLNLTEILGNEMHLHCTQTGTDNDLIVCLTHRVDYLPDDTVRIGFKPECVHLFDRQSGNSLLGRDYCNKVPEEVKTEVCGDTDEVKPAPAAKKTAPKKKVAVKKSTVSADKNKTK